MVHPQPPDDQQHTGRAFQELERTQVRHEADRVLLWALGRNVGQGRNRRESIERLNNIVAVLHSDLEYYRQKLLRQIGEQPIAPHLHPVPTSAATTASARGYRTEAR